MSLIHGDGQSIVLPDWTEIEVLRAAMRDGTLDHYASTRQAGEEMGATKAAWG